MHKKSGKRSLLEDLIAFAIDSLQNRHVFLSNDGGEPGKAIPISQPQIDSSSENSLFVEKPSAISDFSSPFASATPRIIEGTARSDRLEGRYADRVEVFNGHGGSDIFFAGPGIEIYKGGSGRDTVSYRKVQHGVNVSLANPELYQGNPIFSSIENLTGSNFNDQLTGNKSVNLLSGGQGNDTLRGIGGGDTLDGGGGDDLLISDNISRDIIHGGAGFDRLRLTKENSLLDLRTVHTSRWTGIDAIDADGGHIAISAQGIVRISDSSSLMVENAFLDPTGDWYFKGFCMHDNEIARVYGQQYAQHEVELVLGKGVTSTHPFSNVINLAHACNTQRIDGFPLPEALNQPPYQINNSPNPQGKPWVAQIGYAVSAAGDFNGDGYDDIIIGAPNVNFYLDSPDNLGNTGAAYILYGSAHGIDLPNLSDHLGNSGIRIFGDRSGASLGFSVASAGDINGDGIDDVIIGAPVDGHGDGGAYVIYGRNGGFPANADLNLVHNLRPDIGFRIIGPHLQDQTGQYNGFPEAGSSVASAGDINGDGINDLLIGAPFTDVQGPNGRIVDAGAAYVIYGRDTYENNAVDLADFYSPSFDGTAGLRILGVAPAERAGIGVAALGDVNGDGYADLAITTPNANHNGADPANQAERTGSVYVLFGSGHGFGNHGTVDLAHLQTGQGLRIDGMPSSLGSNAVAGRLGESIAAIGDVNGDGIADFVVGADRQEHPTTHAAEVGGAYIIYGSHNLDDQSVFSLSNLTAAQGVHLVGQNALDRVGFSVSSAGDFNHDGIADLIVGSVWASVPATSTNNGIGAGASYVIYGHQGGIGTNGILELGDLFPEQGFEIRGAHGADQAGVVSKAGDINHDGYDDLIIGAYAASYGGNASGSAYILYGGGFVPPEATAHHS